MKYISILVLTLLSTQSFGQGRRAVTDTNNGNKGSLINCVNEARKSQHYMDNGVIASIYFQDEVMRVEVSKNTEIKPGVTFVDQETIVVTLETDDVICRRAENISPLSDKSYSITFCSERQKSLLNKTTPHYKMLSFALAETDSDQEKLKMLSCDQ